MRLFEVGKCRVVDRYGLLCRLIIKTLLFDHNALIICQILIASLRMHPLKICLRFSICQYNRLLIYHGPCFGSEVATAELLVIKTESGRLSHVQIRASCAYVLLLALVTQQVSLLRGKSFWRERLHPVMMNLQFI